MTIEDRLRDAIARHTTGVEPSADALERIEEKLMQTQTDLNRKRWLIGAGAAAAVVAVIVGVLAVTDDGDEVETADTTTTSEETTTTEETTTISEPEETTTTSEFAVVDPAQTIFPDPATSQRFEDPVALVSTFARDFVGMTDPVIGELMQGDSRSGEIEVRGFAEGAPTTVLVRQLEDDSWFVIGAVTDSIQPATPEPGATVTSPIALSGQAYAFEGTVQVELRVDGMVEPLAETFVTGRGDGVLGDYEGELPYDPQPAGTYATVLYLSEGGEDGAPIQFAATRVLLS
jgi:hypothetical protein